MAGSVGDLRAEVEQRLGFLPPFLEGALAAPDILESLWRQTLAGFVDHPAPEWFKLGFALRLVCRSVAPYAALCHLLALADPGPDPEPALELLRQAAPPLGPEADLALASALASAPSGSGWLPAGSPLAAALLDAAELACVRPAVAVRCRPELRRVLGPDCHLRFAALLAWSGQAERWIAANPDLAWDSPRTVRDRLSPLLRADPGLASSLRQRGLSASALSATAPEARRAENVLRDTEVRYRGLIETSRDVIFSLASDGRVTALNPVFEELTGWPRSEWLGSDFSTLIHPDDLPLAREMLAKVNLGQKVPAFELRVLARGGGVLHGEFVASAQFRDGRVVGAFGFARDITDRKRSEEALRENRRFLETLISNLPGAVYRCRNDRDWTMEFISAGVGELTGYPPEDFIRNRRIALTQLYHPDDIGPARKQVEEALAERRPFETMYRIRCAKGQEKWLWERGRGVFSPQGELLFLEGYLADLTGRKRTEDALRESVRRLEIAHAELRATQGQLVHQERLRALGELASGIAHNFNNALSPIVGFTELLLQRSLEFDEDLRRDLETIYTAAKDAANVVRRMREFYRPRDANDVLWEVDPNVVVRQAIKLAEPKWKGEAQSHGVTLELSATLGDPPRVLGRESELREMLVNLIFNAIDAMPRGGSLSICTRAQAGQAVLEVADTGVGMSEEVARRCFDPFFSTKGERGTGLGLSMVQGTVNRLRGTIEVRSEVGKGTTFDIRLPAAPAPRMGDTRAPAPPPERPLHVLIVDDDPLATDVLVRYLRADGHTYELARDGQEGLERFDPDRFDLVVTDNAMPRMSGEQLAAAVRERTDKVPVLLLTGFADLLRPEGEKLAGIDAVLNKPVTLQEWRSAIAQVRERPRGEAAEKKSDVSVP